MKAPKVSKPDFKEKISNLKTGKVKKSHGVASKKLTALSSLKNAEQALDFIKSNAENVELKSKVKQKKEKVPPNQQSINSSPKGNNNSPRSGVDSHKKQQKKDAGHGNASSNESGKKKNAFNSKIVTSANKMPKKKIKSDKSVSKPVQQENNSSPVKGPGKKRKGKIVPLDMGSAETPVKNPSDAIQKKCSPEVLLGLQIEKALSPKSKKNKKKQLVKEKLQTQGKIEVTKKENTKESDTPAKKKRRKRRRSKVASAPVEEFSMFEIVNVSCLSIF